MTNDELLQYIQTLRPNIRPITAKNYVSQLSTLFRKNNSGEFNIEWFKNTEAVLAALEGRPITSIRAVLNAICVLLGEDTPKEYRTVLIDKTLELQKQYDSNEMTEKQKDNWLTFDEVKANWKKAYDEIKPLLNSKGEITNNQLYALSRFMMLTCTSGVFFPPRRCEFITLVLKPTDKAVDNWIDLKKKEFVWNQYKTSKLYGTQRVPYGKDFNLLLKRYLKRIGNQKYLIFGTDGEAISQPNFTQTLNRMYGRNVSTTMLRHIYLSHIHKDTPKIEDLKRIATAMGHTLKEGMQYSKK